MPVMDTSTFAKDLWPGVKGWIGLSYRDFPVQYTSIYQKEISDRAYEEYVSAVGLGYAPVKPQGAPITYASMKQGYVTRLTHYAVALGFMITWEAFKFGQSQQLARKRGMQLGRSLRLTKEVNGGNVLNRAFDSNYVGGDGVELCSAVHPFVNGGTWANEPETAAMLSEDAIEQAVKDIRNWTDEAGMKISVRPRKLVVSGDKEFDAARLLLTDKQPGGANNDINAVKRLGKLPEGVMVYDYLDQDDPWFILTDCPDGLIYQEAQGDIFDQDNDFDTKNAKYAGFGMYCFGFVDAHGVYGSPGSV